MENIPITIPYVIDLDDHEGSGIPTLIRYLTAPLVNKSSP